MATLFAKILCPIDFNPNAEVAFRTALQITGESGGKILLLHVVPIPISAVGQPIVLEPFSGAEHDARARLDHLIKKETAADRNIEVVVVSGEPAIEILRVAQTSAATAIVMATHGRTGLGHLILGSVAERVVREAPCPVITVRTTEKVK